MVEVRVKRRLGVRVRIRWDAGCWSVTTNLAGAKLPIARRTFASLQQRLKRVSRIGAELDLTDDDLAQLWQAAGIIATDGDLSRYVVPTPGVGDHATVGHGVTKHAVGAGAELLQPPTDMLYRARQTIRHDPFGHVWIFLTLQQDLSPEEIVRHWQQVADSTGSPPGVTRSCFQPDWRCSSTS